MTDERRIEEADLGPLFEAERRDAALPAGDWMARMESLALDEQPAPRAAEAPAAAPPPRAGWRAALRAFGGWPAMAGLAAACAAGVWIGVASPDAMTTLISGDSSDLLSAMEPASGFDYAMLGL